jgi:predicted PurR-regulated permease PerM
MTEKNRLLMNFSTWSIIKVILVLLVVYLVFLVGDALLIFYIALIFAAAIDPWADLAEKHKLPRGLAVIVTYILLLGILSLSLTLLVGPLTEQFRELIDNFPALWQKLTQLFSSFKAYSIEHGFYQQIKEALMGLNLNLGERAGGLLTLTKDIFQALFSFLMVLILTFFLVISKNFFRDVLKSAVPRYYHPLLNQLFEKIPIKIGAWVRGQILLCFIIFILVYLGLLLLGVKYSLVLALFAGITEFIPYLGPIIGAIPAVIIAFFQSPILALWVIILYTVIQQLENNILVPKVMQKAIGINPIFSILALLVGARLAGVVGMILAIPTATIISAIIQELAVKEKKDESKI